MAFRAYEVLRVACQSRSWFVLYIPQGIWSLKQPINCLLFIPFRLEFSRDPRNLTEMP